jgi:hypothetical protein
VIGLAVLAGKTRFLLPGSGAASTRRAAAPRSSLALFLLSTLRMSDLLRTIVRYRRLRSAHQLGTAELDSRELRELAALHEQLTVTSAESADELELRARRFRRYPARLAAQLFWAEERCCADTYISNLGAGGLSLGHMPSLPPGSLLVAQVPELERGAAYRLPGVVVWSTRSGLGVCFVGLPSTLPLRSVVHLRP